MEQFEYFTTFLTAEAKTQDIKDWLKSRNPKVKNPPVFTPEALIPELNSYGAQGWEIVSMTPVAGIGKKGDVHFPGGEPRWSNVYFCVFKRRKLG
ncbi:MAG: hypothetical protein HXY40_02950 [Chloroflexi bacterium]|nr:hypothetical protein [Chloroflexota bacterium]